MNWNALANRKKMLGLCLSAAVVFSGASAMGAVPSAHAATAAEAGTQQASSQSLAADIIATGKQFLGTPYLFGAKTGQTNKFDCSSFMQYIYGKYGINLPRTSKEQSTEGVFVPRDELQPGDLVFFYSPIHHVGIYIGNGKVMHTYGDPGVTITDLDSGWWNDHYKTARRVIPASSGLPSQPSQPDDSGQEPENSQPQNGNGNGNASAPSNDWWSWFAGSRS